MDKGELRILFSEQNNETVQNIRRFFDNKGIKTYFCARDGREVLKSAEQIKPINSIKEPMPSRLRREGKLYATVVNYFFAIVVCCGKFSEVI